MKIEIFYQVKIKDKYSFSLFIHMMLY